MPLWYFWILSSGIAKSWYSGIMTHNKGAHSGKTHRNDGRNVHQPPARVICESNTTLQDGGEGIKTQKGEHQDQDALGGSGLRGCSGGNTGAADVLNLLLVPVQNGNHGAAGPDNEDRKRNFRKNKKCYI